MGDRHDKMRMHHNTKDTLDILVHNLCAKTQLTENTIRELFRDGWKYLEDNGQLKWVKGG